MGDLIQISAPISNGSSGSPVLNAQGEVIGVATLVLRSSQNLNFAVPISALKQLLETKPLSKGEFESKGALANQQAAPENKEMFKLPEAPSPDQQFASDPEAQKFEIAKKASNWIEAFRIAKSLVSRYPESSSAHFQMGYAASELSLHEVALRSYQESIAKDPENSSAWNNLGYVYSKFNKPLDAEKAYARAVEVNPTYSLAWVNLARCRSFNEKWEEATQALIALAQVDKAASDKLLGDIQKVFSRSWPEGLSAMTAIYRARYPLATSDPESLGKKLAARFLSFGAGESVDAELRSYADVVGPYFGETRKVASEILKDLIEYRQKWPVRSYDLNSFESAKLNSSKNILTARYSFRYQVAGNGKQRKGVIKQETTFSRISDDFWIVKGVRTLGTKEE
jgi:tetratricopeptide (TPR) repeat protein